MKNLILSIAILAPGLSFAATTPVAYTEKCALTGSIWQSYWDDGWHSRIENFTGEQDAFHVEWIQRGVRFALDYTGSTTMDSASQVYLELTRSTSTTSPDGKSVRFNATQWANTISDGGKGSVSTVNHVIVATGEKITDEKTSQQQWVDGKPLGDRIIVIVVKNADGTTTDTTDINNVNVQPGDSRPIATQNVCMLYPHSLPDLDNVAPAPFGKAVAVIGKLIAAVDAASDKVASCAANGNCSQAQQELAIALAARDSAWPKKILNPKDFVGSWPVIPE